MAENILYSGSVPTFAIDIVRERVEKVNKRAFKRGFPAVTISVGATKLVSDPYGCRVEMHQMAILPCDCVIREVEYSDIEIAATGRLAMAGWRLIGVIAADAVDKDGHAVPMVTNVPGETFSGTVTDAALCQHCQTRRYRTETFLVQHDDGRIVQVGRQCIRDFLGHDPAGILAGLDAFRSLVISDSERESWGASAPVMYSPDEIIAASARIVAKVGWYVSKAKAVESLEDEDRKPLSSTASDTWDLLRPPLDQYDRKFQAEHPYDETAKRIHENTVEALANLNPRNDWEFKLAEYRDLARVGSRHVGVIASSVILGLRLEERKAAAAAKPESNYVGKIGERITVEATVTFMRDFGSDWGTKTLVKFESATGDLAWWATSYLGTLDVGHTVALTGTVKAQDVDKYTKRPTTTLTRCKIG